MDRTVLKAYKFIFQHSYDFNSFVTLNISLNMFYFIYICNGSVYWKQVSGSRTLDLLHARRRRRKTRTDVTVIRIGSSGGKLHKTWRISAHKGTDPFLIAWYSGVHTRKIRPSTASPKANDTGLNPYRALPAHHRTSRIPLKIHINKIIVDRNTLPFNKILFILFYFY